MSSLRPIKGRPGVWREVPFTPPVIPWWRWKLARALRDLAEKVDGRHYIDGAMHKINVKAMNNYIKRKEGGK